MSIDIEVRYSGPVNPELDEALEELVSSLGLHFHSQTYDALSDRRVLFFTACEPANGRWVPMTQRERDDLAVALTTSGQAPGVRRGAMGA